MQKNPVLFTIKEASRQLGISPKTLRRQEKSGKIKSIRTLGGHRRFTLEAINAAKDNRIPFALPSSPQEVSILNLFNFKLISFVLVSSFLIFIANYPGKIGYLANRLTGIPIPGIPEEELVHIPEERDLLSILSAQKGVYEGDVSIVGNLDIPLTTNTKDLIVSSSATINKLSVSSGLVVAGNEIINSSGKIPAINGYYFEDSSGENLTNVNDHHLNGVAASSFLRSDQSDTAEGAINFTASPGSTDVSGGPVYINPASTTSNYTLLGIAVGGTQKFKIDAEGDI